MADSLIESTVKYTGAGAFLAPFYALPLVVLWGLLLLRYCGEGKGLGERILETTGGFIGKIILILYFIWGVFLFAVRLRTCVQGFLTVGYQEGSLLFLLPLLALFVLWMSGASLAGFARSTTLYFGIVALVFLVLLTLSFPSVDWKRVFPIWTKEVSSASLGIFPILGMIGYGVFACFFLGEVDFVDGDSEGENPRNHGKTWLIWSLIACSSFGLLLYIAEGSFGVGLLSEMTEPFYQLSKGIGVQGAFQRIESLVSAIWTFAEFLLLGLLLRASAVCGKLIFGKGPIPYLSALIVLLALLLTAVFPKIHEGYGELILWGNLLFAWVLPVVLFLLGSISKKKKKT